MDRGVINHIGVSGGKDSTALLLWAIHESGYDHETIKVSFCNTGNEAPETIEYLQMLREKVFPIEEITPELSFYDLVKKSKRFPGVRARFCTKELKVVPTKKHITKMIESGADVVLHSGIRRAESTKRAAQTEEFIDDPFFDCKVRRPLLNWSIQDVWDIHKRYGIPRNPLYDMGMTRVGCYPCVLCRKEEIGKIAQRDPARIAFLKRMEEEACAIAGHDGVTFFQRSKVPERFWSKETTWLSPSERTEAGQVIRLATIEDVARWGLESPDVWQMDFDYDEIEEEARSCPSAVGFCE